MMLQLKKKIPPSLLNLAQKIPTNFRIMVNPNPILG